MVHGLHAKAENRDEIMRHFKLYFEYASVPDDQFESNRTVPTLSTKKQLSIWCFWAGVEFQRISSMMQ
jgi:hypothetical protein